MFIRAKNYGIKRDTGASGKCRTDQACDIHIDLGLCPGKTKVSLDVDGNIDKEALLTALDELRKEIAK